MADDQNFDDETETDDEFPEPLPPLHPHKKPSEENPPVEGPPIEEEPEEEEEEESIEDRIGDEALPYSEEEEIRAKDSTVKKISASQIPLKIKFEIGRINVSLEELQKMNPGYKLPIDVNPRIIDLTVNGKSIGKGELIEVGDTVGVKVVELY